MSLTDYATQGSRHGLGLPDRIRGADQDLIALEANPYHQLRGEPSARSVEW
jgi:hypothetical protein